MVTGIFTFVTLNRSISVLNQIKGETNVTIQKITDLQTIVKETKAYSTNWVYVSRYEKDKERLAEIHATTYPDLKANLDSIVTNADGSYSGFVMIDKDHEEDFSVLAHEIGHALGLLHNTDNFIDMGNLMSPLTSETFLYPHQILALRRVVGLSRYIE